MNVDDLNDLRKAGFTGFITIEELKTSTKDVPQQAGVYLVLRDIESEPEFLDINPAGLPDGKKPTQEVTKLKKKWVEGARILYIGKSGGSNKKATLRSRINQFVQFGLGLSDQHWGGRYVWQLKDSHQLLLCWKITGENDPIETKQSLMNEFQEQHGTKPFANIRGKG